jgi:DNA-directed RNA polymerase beta subunit
MLLTNWQILRVKFKLADPDNRDHYAHRRLDLCGPLLKELYSEMMKVSFTLWTFLTERQKFCRDIKGLLARWLKVSFRVPPPT